MMEARYRAQDMNGRIYDYQGKPEINVNIWSSSHVCDFKGQGKPNPNWKTACFELSQGEPVIIDGILCAGILCAPGSVKITPEMIRQDDNRVLGTVNDAIKQYKTNRTPEQFDDHLRTTSCTGQDRKHSHYYKDVSKLDVIDVYRIIDLYNITDPCDQHALKKILCPGERGHKDIIQDTQDVIDTMRRKLEMFSENVK